MKKLTITSDFAHFKIPYSSKVQKTYLVPPISVVIGILKTIYNKEIDDFKFGYTFTYRNKHKEIQKIYKEINIQKKKEYERYDKTNHWVSDIPIIEYLYKPKLIIYTDIQESPELLQILNLGRTDCIAKLKIEDVKLYEEYGCGLNQWTPLNYGDGLIKRISTETVWNPQKGIYNIHTELLRCNETFEYNYNFDRAEDQNIFMWNYRKRGNISESKYIV